MKIRVNQEALAGALKVVGRAVSTRSTLPILSNVLLAAEHGRLRLSATDLGMSIIRSVGAQVAEEGSLTVPARVLAEFVSSLSAEEVCLQAEGAKLRVSAGKSAAELHGMPAEEFPVLPAMSDEPAVTLEAGALKRLIERVVFAAATDDSRPVLAGALVKFEGGKLTMAAADGFRLAVKEQEVPAGPDHLSVIVPARALDTLAKLAADGDAPVEITVSQNRSQLRFHMEDLDVATRLIDGNFPNYGQIVPKSYETRAVVKTQELLAATRRALIFARDSSYVLKIQFELGVDLRPGRVLLTAQTAELGSGADELAARVEGTGGWIAFNAKYLLDMLSVAGNGEVALETQAPNAPAVLRPTEEQDWLYVLMPMHLANR